MVERKNRGTAGAKITPSPGTVSISHEIEAKIDILELAGEYVQLKKSGRNWKGLSPFKPERTPSFIVSPDKNIAYCFSTHRGGGPIRFLMELEKLTYGEALQILAKRAGVELKTNYYKESGDAAGNMYEIHEISAAWYHDQLFLPANRDALEYILKRGLTEQSLKDWQIGYGGDGRGLWEKLKSKNYPEKDVVDSGVFAAPGRDKFWQRITFPIRNYRGDVVGFSARALGDAQPKYLNSPATRIFDKSSVMFGLSKARQEIAKKDAVVIVEGQMDVVTLHQHGFTNVVGLSGTALTPQQIRQLIRITRTITLCLDADSAGVNATFNCVDALANEDVNVKVVRLGDFKDPDEVLKAGADFGALLADSLTHIGFYIEQGGKRFDIGTVQGKKSLTNEVLKRLVPVESAVETDLYLSEVSQRLGIGKDVLHSELRNLKRNPAAAVSAPASRFPKTPSEDAPAPAQAPDPYRDALRTLVAGNKREVFLKNFPFRPDDLTDPRAASLRSYLADGTVDPEDAKILEVEAEERLAGAQVTDDAVVALAREQAKNLYKTRLMEKVAAVEANPADLEAMKQQMELIMFGKQHRLI